MMERDSVRSDETPRRTPPEEGSLAAAIERGLEAAGRTKYWYAKIDAIEIEVREYLNA